MTAAVETTEAPVAVRSTAVATIKGVALAKVRACEPALLALAERYRDVVYDVATPKGLAEAKAARHDLRENGRYAVQRAEQAVKDEANAVKKEIAPEAERLIAIVKPTEDALDKIITAREEAIEAEKEAKRQAEAARVAAHTAAIARIRSFIGMADGLPAERIKLGIEKLEAMAFGDECEDHKAQYEAARDETLASLRKMHADTLAREVEAARLEAQRQEQARVAAEQARVADELAEKQRKLAEQAAELERQQRAVSEAAERAKADADKKQREEDAKRIADQALQTAAAPAPAVQPSTQVAAVVARPAPAAAPAASEPATLKLGTICERLGFAMTASFVADTLGVQHAATDKAAKLYRESQFGEICRALIVHVGEVAEQHAAA